MPSGGPDVLFRSGQADRGARLAVAGEDPSRVNAAAFIVGGSACMIRSFGSDPAAPSGPPCGQGDGPGFSGDGRTNRHGVMCGKAVRRRAS